MGSEIGYSTGSINIATGEATDSGAATDGTNSGNFRASTGNSATQSGALDFHTGTGVTSGKIEIHTGIATTGVSGLLSLSTGDDGGIGTGAVYIGSGSTTSGSSAPGTVTVSVGSRNAGGIGSDVTIRAGNSASDELGGHVKIYPYVGATTTTLEVSQDTIQLGDCSSGSNHGCPDDVNVNPSSKFQVDSGGSIVMQELTNNHGLTIASSGNTIGGNLVVENHMTISGKLTVVQGIDAQQVGITASDMRLKTDIVRLEGSLAKVRKLRGVYYNWVKNNDSPQNFDEKRHVGVIAQE